MSQPRKEIKKTYSIVGEQSPTTATLNAGPEEIHIPISFEAWFLQVQSKYGFKPELQQSVKKHFEARGFTDSKDFMAGLRDFGYNV